MTTPISRQELQAKLASATPPALVEALGSAYFFDAHLPGAINIPPDQVDRLAPRPDRSGRGGRRLLQRHPPELRGHRDRFELHIIVPFQRGGPTFTAMGRFGNVMLTNGQTRSTERAEVGEVVRLHLLNSANTRTRLPISRLGTRLSSGRRSGPAWHWHRPNSCVLREREPRSGSTAPASTEGMGSAAGRREPLVERRRPVRRRRDTGEI